MGNLSLREDMIVVLCLWQTQTYDPSQGNYLGERTMTFKKNLSHGKMKGPPFRNKEIIHNLPPFSEPTSH